MAKENSLQHVFRNSGTFRRPRASALSGIMNKLSQNFFTGTGWSINEDCNVRLCNSRRKLAGHGGLITTATVRSSEEVLQLVEGHNHSLEQPETCGSANRISFPPSVSSIAKSTAPSSMIIIRPARAARPSAIAAFSPPIEFSYAALQIVVACGSYNLADLTDGQKSISQDVASAGAALNFSCSSRTILSILPQAEFSLLVLGQDAANFMKKPKKIHFF